MAVYKQKKNRAGKGNRLLISVTVLGSAGPIRFVVNEDEPVSAVIDHALKSYAREGRLPLLGSDFNNFMLYSPISGTEALLPWETIGSFGVRNFFLCKKPQTETVIAIDDDKASPVQLRGWNKIPFGSLVIKWFCFIPCDLRIVSRINKNILFSAFHPVVFAETVACWSRLFWLAG
ncbi:Unknown protein [Striga hermonthica]|uniref:DUF7054 domain-containing protein n=1 Tax=Striga hermonthica TaxID=68872 RepID=A0A9N7RHN9_STRHE|nr:Unknown protein [Striga hermonthica]